MSQKIYKEIIYKSYEEHLLNESNKIISSMMTNLDLAILNLAILIQKGIQIYNL